MVECSRAHYRVIESHGRIEQNQVEPSIRVVERNRVK